MILQLKTPLTTFLKQCKLSIPRDFCYVTLAKIWHLREVFASKG